MIENNSMAEAIKAVYASLQGSACEYCDADSELIEPSPNVFVMEIRHDDDCPELARHQPGGRA